MPLCVTICRSYKLLHKVTFWPTSTCLITAHVYSIDLVDNIRLVNDLWWVWQGIEWCFVCPVNLQLQEAVVCQLKCVNMCAVVCCESLTRSALSRHSTTTSMPRVIISRHSGACRTSTLNSSSPCSVSITDYLLNSQVLNIGTRTCGSALNGAVADVNF